jgi:5-enolpyruvylshikimate-3-phosphate synthase
VIQCLPSAVEIEMRLWYVTVFANRILFMVTGNAGTAMRPLAGVLCAGKGNFVLDGTPRMRERPIDDLVDGLLQVRRE